MKLAGFLGALDIFCDWADARHVIATRWGPVGPNPSDSRAPDLPPRIDRRTHLKRRRYKNQDPVRADRKLGPAAVRRHRQQNPDDQINRFADTDTSP